MLCRPLPRFFSVVLNEDGQALQTDIAQIAAVDEESAQLYAQSAVESGHTAGFLDDYRYLVLAEEGNTRVIFLDCGRSLSSFRTTLLASVALSLLGLLAVLVLLLILSHRIVRPVAESYEKQKQFITDASHELKTPITVIATSLKVLEMETGENKWIDKSLAQTEKLRDLVNSLVSLSRLDEEQSPLKMAEFPISEAISETAESFRDYAEANDHELQLEIAPELTYIGDEYAIRQLVSILLDNAVKYADEHACIRLSLEKGKKGPVIRTVNSCMGLTQQQADKLFDRFYRVDQSRTTGGFGIGLSMARSIAEGHKGSIKATCCEDNKIEFTVSLGKCV